MSSTALSSDAPPFDSTDARPMTDLSSQSRVPLYHQIYVVLRDNIVSGRIQSGEVLPGEQDLARDFNVSRITAKRALNELAASGFVVRERGRGTRVTEQAPQPSARTSLDGWLENISQMGVATEAQVLEFGYVPASALVARSLKISEGDRVQRAVRVRSRAGHSLSYLTTWLPGAIGDGFGPEDLEQQPLLQLLERAGVQVASARQTVSATLADPIVASALDIDAGAALLEITRIVSDRDGRPVEFIRVLYRPDRYQFEMDLKRVGERESSQWTRHRETDLNQDIAP